MKQRGTTLLITSRRALSVLLLCVLALSSVAGVQIEKMHVCGKDNPSCCQYIEKAEEVTPSCCHAPAKEEKNSCPTSKSSSCRCFTSVPVALLESLEIVLIPVTDPIEYAMIDQKNLSVMLSPQSPPPKN